MAPKTQTYYSWNSKTLKQFRITPKQFRLIGDSGSATVVKTNSRSHHLQL